MKPESLDRLFVTIALIVVWAVLALSNSTYAQAPEKAQAPSPGHAAAEQLNKARESFLAKDYRKATSEVRQAARMLADEAERAVGHTRQELADAGQGLNGLADRIEKQAVKSEKELNGAFDRAKAALSHSSDASSSIPIRMAGKASGPVDLSTAVTRIAKQAMPAVVYIEITESREVENPFGPLANDPNFRRFFGIPKMPKRFKQEVHGLGTGMIIDDKGHILTNYHVAGKATKMQVTLADGTSPPAKLVGGDAKTDPGSHRSEGGQAPASPDLRGFGPGRGGAMGCCDRAPGPLKRPLPRGSSAPSTEPVSPIPRPMRTSFNRTPP